MEIFKEVKLGIPEADCKDFYIDRRGLKRRIYRCKNSSKSASGISREVAIPSVLTAEVFATFLGIPEADSEDFYIDGCVSSSRVDRCKNLRNRLPESRATSL